MNTSSICRVILKEMLLHLVLWSDDNVILEPQDRMKLKPACVF